MGGPPERWLIYRKMVRSRLLKVIHAALPRTRRSAGDAWIEQRFDEWLRTSPPKTRFFREIPVVFHHDVGDQWSSSDIRPWIQDLALFEVTCWSVKYLEHHDGEPKEFSFDRPPIVNPALRVLHVTYPVHKKSLPESRYQPGSHHLCVYRDRSSHEAITWTLNPMAKALLESWIPGDRSVTECVQQVSRERDTGIDQTFLEKLSEMLADFLQRGIILGSR